MMLERGDPDSKVGYDSEGKYFKLTADIDLSGRKELNDSRHAYLRSSGHFDGQNHKVSVNIQSEIYASLFGEIVTSGIAIRNLNVEGSVRSTNDAAGLAWHLYDGIIENCSFTGTVEAVYSEAAGSLLHTSEHDGLHASDGPMSEPCVGGIVVSAGGMSFMDRETSCTIRNCTFSGTIRASAIENTSFGVESHAGGIAAKSYTSKIENCAVQSGSEIYASVSITGGGSSVVYSGSIVGYIRSGSVTGCTSGAALSGAEDGSHYKGGIAGYDGMQEYYGTDSTYGETFTEFSGNTWPSQYPEIGNATGSTTNTPDYTNYTPDYGYENPGEGYSGYPDYTSGGSSGNGGGCNSSTASILLAAVLAVKFRKR